MTEASTSGHVEFDVAYALEQIRRSRHPLRRFVKGFYLRDILREVRGPTIDFGCGAGQLLRRLPLGSVGLEVNPHLIHALREEGLDVQQSQGDQKDFALPNLPAGRFLTLVIAHVLEHLVEPVAVLRELLAACDRLGIQRVIVIVPGVKGYASDLTHKTFIDRSYVDKHLGLPMAGYTLARLAYFPGPWAWIGRHFVFHEMKLVFERAT